MEKVMERMEKVMERLVVSQMAVRMVESKMVERMVEKMVERTTVAKMVERKVERMVGKTVERQAANQLAKTTTTGHAQHAKAKLSHGMPGVESVALENRALLASLVRPRTPAQTDYKLCWIR